MAQQAEEHQVTKKAYVSLMEIPKAVIGRCAQVLPNKLQCWRAGDFQVTEATSAKESTVYQLCRTHVTLQKLADKLATQKLAAGESVQEPPAEDFPPAVNTLEALQRLESMVAELEPVAPPPIVVQEQAQSPTQAAYGTKQQVPQAQKSETPKEWEQKKK